MSYIYTLVRKAVKEGKLVRPLCCESCGMIRATFAHHDDYLKPLEVRWLCKPCHGQWHSENGPGLNAELADLPPTRTHKPRVPSRPTSELRADAAIRKARNSEMRDLLTQGWTLQQIGDKYQISRERVRQITGSPKQYRPTRAKMQQKAVSDRLGEINDLRREGKNLMEIARDLQIPVRLIRETPWVEPRAIKHGTMNAYNLHKCRCALCRKKAVGIQAQVSRNLHAKGICTMCRKPAEGGYWMCTPCRAKHYERYSKRKSPLTSRAVLGPK